MYLLIQERRGGASRRRAPVGLAPRAHAGRRGGGGERQAVGRPRTHVKRHGRLRVRLLVHVPRGDQLGAARLVGLPGLPAALDHRELARQTRVRLMEGVSPAKPAPSALTGRQPRATRHRRLNERRSMCKSRSRAQSLRVQADVSMWFSEMRTRAAPCN